MAGYGRFGSLSRVELERFFHLDDEDRRLIGARRRDHNRLGFALQVVTVRNLGMFLADPLDVPPELVDYLAEQLGIEDPSCLPEYLERRPTRFEHQAEVQQAYGLKAFSEVEKELAAWIADQAWMTGDGPKAILTGAVAWLRERQALLPGHHDAGEDGGLRPGGRRSAAVDAVGRSVIDEPGRDAAGAVGGAGRGPTADQ